MSVGCVVSVAIPVVEEIIKHQSILNKLVKSLKKCLCDPKSSGSSDEEREQAVKETLIQQAVDELEELCNSKNEQEQQKWTAKERGKWRKLTRKLITLGRLPPESLRETPWQTIAVTKEIVPPKP
jgi:hypothetical protein